MVRPPIIKLFKVAQVDQLQTGKRRYRHVLISIDGECWSVVRNRGSTTRRAWEIGTEVPLVMDLIENPALGDRKMVPDWRMHGCAQPTKLPLPMPYDAVAQLWGVDTAGKFFTQHSAAPVSSAKQEAKPRLTPTLRFSSHHFSSAANSPLFCTPDEKSRIANQFLLFAKRGFELRFFSRPLYEKLSMMFGFEALQGQATFYDRWFSSPRSRFQFVQQIAQHVATTNPHDELVDLERAIQSLVIQKVLRRAAAAFPNEAAAFEQQLLSDLLRKHGLPNRWQLPNQIAAASPLSPPPQSQQCSSKKCGALNLEAARFCARCGRPLKRHASHRQT